MQSVDLRCDRRTFADLAYRAILNGILSHELRPGDCLRANELASKFGISRSPVDRALDRLAGEGFVEYVPGSGPFVTQLTVSDVLGLYDLRLLLETYAVEKGLDRVNGEFLRDLDHLVAVFETIAAALEGVHETRHALDNVYEQRRRMVEADREIHAHIVSISQNKTAQDWHRKVDIHIRSFQFVNIARFHRRSKIDEHRVIVDALSKRDAAASVSSVREHVLASRRWFLDRAEAAGIA